MAKEKRGKNGRQNRCHRERLGVVVKCSSPVAPWKHPPFLVVSPRHRHINTDPKHPQTNRRHPPVCSLTSGWPEEEIRALTWQQQHTFSFRSARLDEEARTSGAGEGSRGNRECKCVCVCVWGWQRERERERGRERKWEVEPGFGGERVEETKRAGWWLCLPSAQPVLWEQCVWR